MKAYIFDLDNTLFDRYATITAIVNNEWDNVRRYVNPGYTRELATSHFCALEQLYNSYGWKVLYAKMCDANFFNPDNMPSYEDLHTFLVTNFEKVAVPFDFTRPTLEAIRKAGYKTGLITNGMSALQRAKLSMLGISDLFDEIVISGEYAEKMCGDPKNSAYHKPSTSIFTYAVERLGFEASECAYVGDNPLNDMMPARKAGLVPIWIRSKSPWIGDVKDMPELRFDDVTGLLTLI